MYFPKYRKLRPEYRKLLPHAFTPHFQGLEATAEGLVQSQAWRSPRREVQLDGR
jgi:hypothetical protein